METHAVLLPRIDSIQPQHDRVDEWRRIYETNWRRSILDLRSIVRQLPAVGFFKVSGQICSRSKEGRYL